MEMQNQEQGGVPGGGVSGGSAPGNKKKFPWMWVLGGCGCLTILLLIVAAGVGYMVFQKGTDTFSEMMDSVDSVSVENGESGSAGASKGKAGSKAKADAKSGSKSGSKDALTPEKVRGYMAKSLTKGEISDFHKSADAWKKNKVSVEYEKNVKELEALQKKENKSTVEQMRAVRNVGKVATSIAGLSEGFDEHIAKHGGYEKHFSRVLRISGALAATEMMAKQHKLEDKHSDEAIALVLKEQPEIAAEYKKGLAEAKQASAGGKEAEMGSYMAMISGGPGAIAMARMPAASFKTWQSLSVAERKKAEEDLVNSLGVSSYLGLAMNPAMIFQMALMSEVQEINEQK